MYLHTLELTAIEQSFGESNVTVTVHLERTFAQNSYGLIYGVLFTSDSVIEEIRAMFSSNTSSVELSGILYNTHYNLSTTLCGYETQSETISLFYGEDSII